MQIRQHLTFDQFTNRVIEQTDLPADLFESDVMIGILENAFDSGETSAETAELVQYLLQIYA